MHSFTYRIRPPCLSVCLFLLSGGLKDGSISSSVSIAGCSQVSVQAIRSNAYSSACKMSSFGSKLWTL